MTAFLTDRDDEPRALTQTIKQADRLLFADLFDIPQHNAADLFAGKYDDKPRIARGLVALANHRLLGQQEAFARGMEAPREPTAAMIAAGAKAWAYHNSGCDEPYEAEIPDIYRAMLAAYDAGRLAYRGEEGMSDEQIKHMTQRFLGWRLPENFSPDDGISFEPEFNIEYNAKRGLPPQRRQPVGTNLFDAQQAEAMVRYMVEGLPQP